MIKVLADKVLGFSNGDRDKNGALVIVKTKIGFCELPDWVTKDKYYELATKDGSLKPYNSSGESEDVLKAQEKLQALQDEIKALQEKRDLLSGDNVDGAESNEGTGEGNTEDPEQENKKKSK